MGLRVTAAVAAGVIVLAVIGAFLAAHHALIGSAPAGQDKNVTAYRSMILSDYDTYMGKLNSTFNDTNQCVSVENAGCPVAIKAVLPTFQTWLGHLESFKTPSGYAVIDGQLRRHLSEKVAVLNAALAFQQAQDQTGFSLAMYAASYEVAWLEPAVFAIEDTYPKVAGSYHDAVSLGTHALDACVNSLPGPGELGCNSLSQHESCIAAAAQICESDVQSSETQIETFLVALHQNPAPSALTSRSARVQTYLGQADTALLAITVALLDGDSVKVSAGQDAFAAAIHAADASFHSALSP